VIGALAHDDGAARLQAFSVLGGPGGRWPGSGRRQPGFVRFARGHEFVRRAWICNSNASTASAVCAQVPSA
jgi:hypothetical protein